MKKILIIQRIFILKIVSQNQVKIYYKLEVTKNKGQIKFSILFTKQFEFLLMEINV